MSKAKKIDQETLKNLNRQIILNHIRKFREISRVDLAQYTKLSPTTVSAITAELIEKNIVTEMRIGESSGGRRPVILGINPQARYVVAVVLTAAEVSFTLLNLEYQVVERRCLTGQFKGNEAVEEAVLKGIGDILATDGCEKQKICGIGISIPGVIDYSDGKVLYSSKLKLKDSGLSSAVTKSTGLKCFVFKDTDALMLGEYNFGIERKYKNVVYINVEDGVGMSYVNSGRLFQPAQSGGLELGHITIDSNGSECRCGNRGCLGAVVSEQAAKNKLRKLIEKGYETEITDTENLSLSDIVKHSNRNDKAARYVLEEQARLLGTAVANILNLFNPQSVIIGGPLSKCSWDFLSIMSDTVRDRALEIYSRNTEICYAKLGGESALMGMANEIFELEIFKPVEIIDRTL